ncbi:MAG: hypothetical protein JWO80_2713 [Bryobacterales bacterium]|nr:hypothetical protein [Bryobacterales bacterium]
MEYRGAIERARKDDVVDAEGREARDIGIGERPQDHVLVADPPFFAQFLQVIDLAAAFPIHIDGAKGFGAEDTGLQVLGRTGGEDEDSIARSRGAGPGAEGAQIGRVDGGIVVGVGEDRDREKWRGDRDGREIAGGGGAGKDCEAEGNSELCQRRNRIDAGVHRREIGECEPSEGLRPAALANSEAAREC